MEQRAPGHTCMDGKIYRKGMLDFKREIEEEIAKLDYFNDPEAFDKEEQLRGMAISCDAIIRLAERHAEKAEELASTGEEPGASERVEDHCRGMSARAGSRAPYLPRGDPDVLVRAPGG